MGDGDRTQQTQYPGGAAAPRVTLNWYDWRDRLVATKQGAQASEDTTPYRPILFTSYDNLGEPVEQQQSGKASSWGCPMGPVAARWGPVPGGGARWQTGPLSPGAARVLALATGVARWPSRPATAPPSHPLPPAPETVPPPSRIDSYFGSTSCSVLTVAFRPSVSVRK